MTEIVKVEKQIEIKSSPDKFFDFFKNNINELPRIFPTNILSVEIVNGDVLQAGSITSWKYSMDGSSIESVKIKIEEVDDATKTMSYSLVEGLVDFEGHDSYKKSKFQVGLGYVNLRKEIKTTNPNSPNDDYGMELSAKVFQGIDAYLANQN